MPHPAHPASAERQSPSPRKPKLPRSTWIVGALALVLLIIGVSTTGMQGLLMMGGLLALITGAYALVTGRASWARLPSRKFAAAVLAASLVSIVIGTSLAPDTGGSDSSALGASVAHPTPTPVASPTRTATPTPTATPIATPSDTPASAVSAADSSTALAQLATLPVKGKAPKTGYDRTGMFGSAWLDVDRNGCDTRNDILARDLTEIAKSGSCRVLTGTLADPYTGTQIAFVRGNATSTKVQIDHVVALQNAWITGAQQLTQDAREALANDPRNLLAVDGPTNSAKGAGDAATWLPPEKSFRCTYVARQIEVKAAYGLWIAPAEHDAMERVLGACGGAAVAPVPVAVPEPVAADPAPVVVPVPVPVEPAPAPAPEPAPAPAPEPAPAPAPAPAVNVHPGGFCSNPGETGVADNGRTYTCGGKGADANGKFHWNA
ncbi:hypothetical protein GCM10022381_32420 [Leifsonia kafniensis]|uniref:GmrSD restriction endonucleases C-terminal domain-containing protein n=1 Tax=Leifsonia kafniensis TaxID=475957 RepID=A0ABP7KTZ5_9MICO